MQEIELKQVNITVVYDDLVNAKISNDAIKEEFNNEVVIIDVPDNNLFIDFPEIKSNCKFQSRYDQKRLHVNANERGVIPCEKLDLEVKEKIMTNGYMEV